MSKEPTRQQLSSKLAYQANTPAFLVRLQKQFGGGGGRHDEDEDDEFEYDGSGRPPIPRRPAIPERPDDEAGSADEEEDEERPQVIVLREGKHLTEREVENEKRKGASTPRCMRRVLLMRMHYIYSERLATSARAFRSGK